MIDIKTLSEEEIKRLLLRIACQFTKNIQGAEDFTQDNLITITDKIKNQDIKTVKGLVKFIEWRFLAQERKKRAKKRAPNEPILSIEEIKIDVSDSNLFPASPAVIPGSKEYHESEEDRIKRSYFIEIPRNAREGIERSLEYIEEFYRYKEQVRIARDQNDKTYRILKDLYALKEKNVADRYMKNKAMEYSRLRSMGAFDISSNRNEISKEDLEKVEEFENLGFDGLLPIQAYIKINELIKDAEIAIFFKLYPSKKFLSLAGSFLLSREDLRKNIPDMRVEPPRLMYATWSKVQGLKRGSKEVNHQKIKLIFSYQNIVTKDTHREFLFKFVRNDLSNYETIRKIQYRNLKFKRLYNKLVKYLYEKSFVDRISIGGLA